MKKQILFIIDSLGCGGAEKSLVSLLSLLDRSKMDISLAIVSQGGALEQLLPTGIHLVPFPKPCQLGRGLSNGLFAACRLLLSVCGIKRHGAELGWICKKDFIPSLKEEYDVAVAYQQGFPTYYVSQKVYAFKKIAWINTDLKKAGYRPHFNRPFYNRMTSVCCVSDSLSGLLPRDGFLDKEHLYTIKDILNVDLIRKMADEPLDTFNGSARFKILTVGRLVPPKNYPLAVEAADILRNKGVDFVWTFIGEGGERSKIETLIRQKGLQKHVFLAGQKLNPYPYFKACDIYVQTSSFEGFGLTISEAKVFHKPIVTTNFPAAHDQITDGENGLIAEMTADSLANKILSILENPDLKDMLVNGTRMEENRTAETEIARANSLLLED